MKKATQQILERKHAMYADYNQKERRDCILMAELGHPMVRRYRVLQQFFSRLRYACNSGARYFSFKDEGEQSEYWAPSLDVSWYPDLPGFGHIYPAHADWMRYIHAAAAAGWPKGVAPTLSGGSWIVTTQNPALLHELAMASLSITGQAETGTRQSNGWIQMTMRLDGPRALVMHRAIVRILRRHHKGFILPLRSAIDDAADETAVPLAEKQFRFGAVKQVSVLPRTILVPLVPVGAGPEVVLPITNRLVDLLKEGFPFHEAADWLRTFLVNSEFRKLQKAFA